MLTNLGLVEYAKVALKEGWGYVWGTFGQVLTESFLQQKIRQYPQGVGSYESVIRSKWMGKNVADCVGLIKGYYWMDENGKFKYDAKTDITADTMLDRAKEKGYIGTMPEIPGVLLHKKGHVGIYIGNGEVIEARSTKEGVIKTKLSAGNWTAWSKCPYIEYVKDPAAPKTTPAKEPVATSPTPTTSDKKTWEYYIIGDVTKQLQHELNVQFKAGLKEDGYLGDLTLAALKRVVVRKGAKGNLVKLIQKRLLALGYKLPKYGADGDFGSETLTAVKQFQIDRKLLVDGEVGINTFKELFKK